MVRCGHCDTPALSLSLSLSSYRYLIVIVSVHSFLYLSLIWIQDKIIDGIVDGALCAVF